MTLVKYYEGSGRGSPFQVSGEFCFVSFDLLYYLDLRTTSNFTCQVTEALKRPPNKVSSSDRARADPKLPDLDA